MKIVNSITQIYYIQYKVNEKLKIQVDKLILAIKEHKWHYISRIKLIESFAQKLETNRVEDPTKLEDFFACTIVVENTKSLKRVKALIKKHFKIEYLRPKNNTFTHKDSSSFVFDDIRLYVRLKPTVARAKGPINDIIFEIQIKTFLQHAWSIATHDLMYKSDNISWTKQRVAYQVKAILENAEVSIEKANTLKRLPGIPYNNQKVQFQNEIKEFILKHFSKAKLPNDIVRLINSLEHLMKVLYLELEDIEHCLIEDTKSGAGIKTLNLSPYLIITQAIINQNPRKIISFMKRKQNGNRIPKKIFLPSEIDTSKISASLNSKKIIAI